MTPCSIVLTAAGVFCALVFAGAADVPPQHPAPLAVSHSDRLQVVLDEAVRATFERFRAAKLQSNELAVTLIDVADTNRPAHAAYRGEARTYPASVVKLFYLVAVHHGLEAGQLKDTPELRRAVRDMIVDSCNEATQYVVDVLTDTTSGPELPPAEMVVWAHKRNAVNRHFAALGYTNLNVNQKTWNEGPYGREREFVGRNYENRNALTTDATARLLTEIALGRCVSGPRSAEMMALLDRGTMTGTASDTQTGEGIGFTGRGLPAGAKLWSKAGWTSTTRHDAAYVELPNGRRFVLVTFTTNHAQEREIIPTVVRHVVSGLASP